MQLNATKNELIWFGSCATLQRLWRRRIQPVNVVWDLGRGVLMDCELMMKQHVNHVISICFHHLQQLRHLRRHVSQAAMKQLKSAIILSRMDYCNSILAELPLSTLASLQHAQNAAAWIVLGLSPWDHVRPALRKLHWLPIIYHIKFKISLLMYLTHMHCCLSYRSQSYCPSATIPSINGSAHLLALNTTYHAWTLSLVNVRSWSAAHHVYVLSNGYVANVLGWPLTAQNHPNFYILDCLSYLHSGWTYRLQI